MPNAPVPESALCGLLSKRAGYDSGAVYNPGHYQRAADGLALRRSLSNAALFGGGAMALSAAIAAAARYSAHQREHMDEAIQPVGVPLHAGKKRRKPGSPPEEPAAKSGAAAPVLPKPWWMLWERGNKWNNVTGNSGDPRNESYGYMFDIPAGLAAPAAAEKSAGILPGVSPFSLTTGALGLAGLYAAYRMHQDSKTRKTSDPRAEYIRTLSRHIARGQFPELAPLYEDEFDPEADIVPAKETGAGASRSGARPAR